ncbi:MAG: hypothetical protein Kow001_08930 [Acidobacteriota bacterium]
MNRHLGRARLLLTLGSVLFALLLVEFGWRILDVDYNPNPNWRYHPVLGWTQEANKTYDVLIDGSPVRVEFNSLGFRDLEHTPSKPAGTRRIAVVGDSFSEAIQVNLEETFFRRLEAKLNQQGPEHWEILNFGVGDFGNAQALLALERFALDFDPDFVVVQIFPLNDICNNTVELAGLCKSDNDLYRPYFVLQDDRLVETRVSPYRDRLRRLSITFGLLERTWYQLQRRREGTDVDERHRRRFQQRGIPDDPLLYAFVPEEKLVEPMRTGWLVSERILLEIDRLLKSRGIPWMAMVVPFEAQVSLDWERFAATHPRLGMQRDVSELRLRRLLEAAGIPCVTLLDAFSKHPEIFFPTRGGHLNPAAHALAAEVLFQRMAQEGWLEPSGPSGG